MEALQPAEGPLPSATYRQRRKLRKKGESLEGGEKEMVARKALYGPRVGEAGKESLPLGELSFGDFFEAGKMNVLQEVQKFFDDRPEGTQKWERKLKVRSRRCLTRRTGRSEFEIRFDADERDAVGWDEEKFADEDYPASGEFFFCSVQREKSSCAIKYTIDELCGEDFSFDQHDRNATPIRAIQEADSFGGPEYRFGDITALVDMEFHFATQSQVEDAIRKIQRSPDADIDDHVPLPPELWNIYRSLCRSQQQVAKEHGFNLGAENGADDAPGAISNRTTLVRSLQAAFEDPEDNAIQSTKADNLKVQVDEPSDHEETDTTQRDSSHVGDCSMVVNGEQKNVESFEHIKNPPELERADPFATPIGTEVENERSGEITVQFSDIFPLPTGAARMEESEAQGRSVTPNHDQVTEHAPSCNKKQFGRPKSRGTKRSRKHEGPVRLTSGNSSRRRRPSRHEVDGDQNEMEIDQEGETMPDMRGSEPGCPETVIRPVEIESGNDTFVTLTPTLPEVELGTDHAAGNKNGLDKDPHCEAGLVELQNVLDGNTATKDNHIVDQRQPPGGGSQPDRSKSKGLDKYPHAEAGLAEMQNVLDENTATKDNHISEHRQPGDGSQPDTSKSRGKRKRKEVERRKSLVGAGSKWEDGRRRSTRVRVPPVEWWNNEKLLYGRVSESVCTLVGIKKLLPTTPSAGRRQQEKRQKFEIKSFVSPRWKKLVEFVAL